MSERALTGTKIVEFASFVSGPYCSKLLADLGAEVIKIEEPGAGDEARRRGPFPGNIPDPEKSAIFLYLNTNKKGITLNVNTPTGKKIFRGLVRSTDILIEDKPPKLMKELGFDYESLKEINPRLIMTSITPFGQTGPYRDYKAYHLNVYHGSGLGYQTPNEVSSLEREPLKGGGFAGDYVCGLYAALATLAALYARGETGLGQHVDSSKQEALINIQRVQVVAYPNDKVNPRRMTQSSGSSGMGGTMRCKDGYVTATLAEDHQWRSFCELLGHPEWWENEKLRDSFTRGEAYAEIAHVVSEWMLSRTKEEIYHQAQAKSCPIAPFLSPEEIMNDRQLKARGFFVEIDHPKAGRIRYPSAPYQFSRTPWLVARPAPLLGEHNEEVYSKLLGYTKAELVKLREAGII